MEDEAAGPDRHKRHARSPSQQCFRPHRPAQHGDPGDDVGQAGDGQDGLRQRAVNDALAVRVTETCASAQNLHGRPTVARNAPRIRESVPRYRGNRQPPTGKLGLLMSLRNVRLIAHAGRTWAGLTAALVLGALPALAFPALSWWWLAWFGFVPLLLVVRAAPTARGAAGRALCGMAGYILATQYWLLPSAGPLLIVMAIGLGALWLP